MTTCISIIIIEFLHEDLHKQHPRLHFSKLGQWGIVAINWVDKNNSMQYPASIRVLIA